MLKNRLRWQYRYWKNSAGPGEVTLIAMATAISSGAKNSNAARATAISKRRFPQEAEGSLRAARRERRLRYTLLPGHSTGRTDMKRRSFRSGVTLSRFERTTMVAIALALCWNSGNARAARSAFFVQSQQASAVAKFADAKLRSTKTRSELPCLELS